MSKNFIFVTDELDIRVWLRFIGWKFTFAVGQGYYYVLYIVLIASEKYKALV